MKQQRRKRHYISLIAFFILALLFSSFSTGISAQEPAVKIWPFPEDLPEQYKSSDFSISAEGLEVPVYASGLNAWGNTVSYASFESTREITVCVTVHFPLETAVILPRSLEKAVQMQGDKVFFTASPGEDITLLPDGDYNGRALHLFVRAPLENVPDSQSAEVLYYAPGYHDLSAQAPVQLASGQTVYLAVEDSVFGI